MTTTLGDHVVAQYARIAAGLEADGLTTADVTGVTEYVHVDRLADHSELAQARLAVFGADGPPVVTVVVDHLFAPDVDVRVDVQTSASGPGDVVRLPLVLPVDAAGEVVAPGDFRGQYTFCLERAGELLDALGLTLAHLVQTIDFSTAATREVYSRCGRPRRELLGPVHPGAAGILVSALPHPEALVGFEFVASRHLPVAVNPGWTRYETLTYNPAVRAGDGLFGSGFAALDPVSQQAVHAGDPAAQAQFTYASVLAVLAAAGAGPEHLTGVTEYVTPGGLAGADAMAAARRDVLGGADPALTRVGCATLLRPEFAVEVIPTAVLPAAAPPEPLA